MHDQADELRQLMRKWNSDCDNGPDSSSADGVGRADRLRKIVVSAGKGGVGTTTVAVNLAVSLARLGCRTILVDANFSGADATWLCGIEPTATIAEVLSGRRTMHEILVPGPGGIQVAPGIWSPAAVPDCSPSRQQRLLHQLDLLGRFADWAIIDAGCGLNNVVRRFWQAADELLVVTTGEAVAVMDAYAAIKLFLGELPASIIRTLVNQSRSESEATAVHARLANAAQRFLGMTLLPAGQLPWDAAVALASAAGQTLLKQFDESPAAQAIDQLAERLLSAGAADDENQILPTAAAA